MGNSTKKNITTNTRVHLYNRITLSNLQFTLLVAVLVVNVTLELLYLDTIHRRTDRHTVR